MVGEQDGRVTAVYTNAVSVRTADGQNLGFSGAELAEIAHIPDPSPIDRRPGQRISSLAD